GVMCNSVTPGAAVGDGTTAFFRSNRPVRTTVMDLLWSGWGDPARATPLPASATGFLPAPPGVKPRPQAPPARADLAVPAPPLDPAAHRALAAAVGEEHVRTDPETRIRHTRGKSTPDLLRIREGDLSDVPAAVLLPAEHDDVLAVMAACAARGLALAPFGGGK